MGWGLTVVLNELRVHVSWLLILRHIIWHLAVRRAVGVKTLVRHHTWTLVLHRHSMIGWWVAMWRHSLVHMRTLWGNSLV